jgi:nucleotide-binding universal stress UspA family protein
MFTSLLVGLDGSRQSQVALAQAISLGRRFRSEIIVVHVERAESMSGLRPQWTARAESGGSGEPDQAARDLLDAAATLVRRAGLAVKSEFRRGDVGETLRELAADVEAIVVGRSGVLGAGDPLGPDTRELIRRCPRPVLVCGSAPSPMDRCLVAYDGQPASEAALSFAARYAEIAEAHLDVLHVADDAAAGHAILARTSAAFSASPFSYETHLASGVVEEAVSAAIVEFHSNALFAGTSREDGRRLVGSHTEAILRATDIPVLVHTEPHDPGARASSAYRRPAS